MTCDLLLNLCYHITPSVTLLNFLPDLQTNTQPYWKFSYQLGEKGAFSWEG